MRTRYGVSPWIDTFPNTRRPDYPRLRDELVADVAIIGGGLTGSATAYACAAAGMKTVLIEAARIGQGSAGRSAGLLLADPGPSFREVSQAHGLRSAKRIFDAWRRASTDGAALLKRLGVRCDLTPSGSIVIASPAEEKALARDHAAREEAEFESRLLSSRQVRQAIAADVAAGIRLRDGFMLDPYRACVGLAAAAGKKRAKLFERTRVTSVRAAATGVEVAVPGGLVRAATVIVTTGTATAEFKPLRRHFKQRESYLVLTEPVPAPVRTHLGRRDAVIADSRSPRYRIRWTADDRILVAGGDQDEVPARSRDAVRVQRTGQLMYELLMIYPAISGLRPEYGWEMPYGETADGIMYIGAHRNYPRHLFALGGGGDSITGAFLAARILAREATGEREKNDAVFGWTR